MTFYDFFIWGGEPYLLVVFWDVLYVEDSHGKCLALSVIPGQNKDGLISCLALKVEPEVEMNPPEMVFRQSFLSPRVTLNILFGYNLKILCPRITPARTRQTDIHESLIKV